MKYSSFLCSILTPLYDEIGFGDCKCKSDLIWLCTVKIMLMLNLWLSVMNPYSLQWIT